MVVRPSFYLCAIVMLAVFCSLAHAQQLNTYQTIKTSPPKMFKLSLLQGDEVTVNVFNTNAQFNLLFIMDSGQQVMGQNEVCFADEICSFSFVSEWEGDGIMSIVVLAHQYSYEILHNGEVIKRELGVVSNFMAGSFFYSKPIPTGNYTFRVSYQSAFTPSIIMTFLDQNITIMANQVNQINFLTQEQLPFYQFHFTQTVTEEQTFDEIIDHFFSVTIQLPNQFLKGCDGTNIYDPKIRACPISDFKTSDTLQISKIGTYPTFQLQKEQKVEIKITIIEVKKWPEFFDNQLLTVYIGNGTDPSAFYGLTTNEIGSKFKMKQQCLMQKTSCTFVFNLSSGDYVIMPFFLQSGQGAFVYLYERFNGNQLVESFYSVLPTISNDHRLYQDHMILEFINHKEKLTELQITCNDPFVMLQSAILAKTQTPLFQGGMHIKLMEFSQDKLMNPDFNKAQIFTSLQPNKSYLLLFTLMSPKKIEQYQEERKDIQGLIDPTMDEDDEETQQQGSFYLETSSFEVKIKNGKFPHKKLSSKEQKKEQSIIDNESQKSQTKQTEQTESTEDKSKDTQNDESNIKPVDSKEQSDNQSHLTTQEQKQSPSSSKQTSILIQVLAAVVVILILLVSFYLCLFNKTSAPENDHKQLVSEQASGSITIPDSAMEISQVIKSEQSMSRSQTTEIEESPQPQQKLYELKQIEHESTD